jgi:hypothetical protein
MGNMPMSYKFLYLRKSTEKHNGPIINNRGFVAIFLKNGTMMLSIQQEMSQWQN